MFLFNIIVLAFLAVTISAKSVQDGPTEPLGVLQRRSLELTPSIEKRFQRGESSKRDPPPPRCFPCDYDTKKCC